ncbi:MAG: DUF5723 family protein [Gilvibacter sp.]|uniref:DUF5723 family protein n=1 Tax=Nonlabens ulvanivorans TaxID=906888 RepID=UPI0032967EC9
MCKRSLFILLLLIGAVGISQNKPILFGYEDIPQSLMVNPAADMPQGMHIGIPFASHLYVHGGSSGASVYDIFKDEAGINQRVTQAIFDLKPSDFFAANQQLEFINFGWKQKQSGIYFSGGIYQELDVMVYFPKDLAILAWEGNRNYIGKAFDLGELSVTGEALTVFHFGASKKVSKNLRLGARAKIYSSIAHFSSTGNKGTFTTVIGDGTVNIYEHLISNADIEVRTSGIQALSDAESGSATVNQFVKRGMLGGNLGLGVDLGMSYDFDKHWTLDASILDLGAVFHTGDVERYESKGDFVLNGVEFVFPALSDGQETVDYYTGLTDQFNMEVPRDTITTGYVQFRPTKLNGSLTYGFGEFGEGEDCNCLNKEDARWREGVGAHFYSIMRPKRPQFAFSVFYYRKLTSFLSAKVAYTWDEYSATNLGMGINADLGWVNFYLMTDNILRYGNLAKAKNVSLQLGLNLKINKQ